MTAQDGTLSDMEIGPVFNPFLLAPEEWITPLMQQRAPIRTPGRLQPPVELRGLSMRQRMMLEAPRRDRLDRVSTGIKAGSPADMRNGLTRMEYEILMQGMPYQRINPELKRNQ